MATPGMRVAGNDIKLDYGVAQVFALKFVTGKSVESRYPGGRVMFTAIDERKLFLDDEDANDFERALTELGIGPADFVKATKIRHARGGGHSIRVEVVEDDEPQSDLERDLTRSIEAQRARQSRRPEAGDRRPTSQAPRTTSTNTNNVPTSATAPPATAKGTMTGLLAGALMASVDAYVIAADYAKSKGIAVEMNLDITGEDIRSSATAMLIQYWREDGTR